MNEYCSWRKLLAQSGFAVATVLFGIACGGSERTPSPEKQSETNASGANTPREPIISLNAIGLQETDSGETWPTEVFNDEAGAQLLHIKDFLKNQGQGDINPFSTDTVTFEPLRPASTETVFEDTAFLVKRSTSPTSSYQVGKAALAADLRAFGSLYQSDTLALEFKIHRIDANSTTVHTAIAVKASGETDTGAVQESANWICEWTNTHPPFLRSIRVENYEYSLGKSPKEKHLFNDCTEAVFAGASAYKEQLAYSIDHWITRIEATFGINVAGWEGIAIGDANGDGLEDVYVCQPGGLPNKLFVQKPDGTVFDASSFSGVDWRIQTQSALFVDLDNDGDQDLVIAVTLGVLFMANDGRGTFTVKASEITPEAAPLGLSSADFDLDGDLDIYATCYSKRRANVSSTILGRPMPYHDANNGGRNVLFRNDREWTFTNATLEVGLDQNNRRFSFSASWEDYDNDGDPDLYVANDYGRNNLYRNDLTPDGAHVFVDVAKEAGVEDISAGMSVSWGDYNLDGYMDLYVSNMWSSAGNRVSYQRQFQSGADALKLSEMRRHARGNSLFMNNGDGTFRDVSIEQGVTMGRWAWGSRFVDLNNDGYEDLFVTNGFITQPDDNGDL